MKTKDSPAIQLLAVLWDGRQEATGHSWLRLNQAMRDGLMLAVRMGLKFHADDFQVMQERFRLHFWAGESLEDFYRLAIAYGNRSAWKAYECYQCRRPFLWPNSFEAHYGGGGLSTHTSTRLVEGSKFVWNDEEVLVTSFNDEKGFVTACSYTESRGKECSKCRRLVGWARGKLLHRYTITHADLRAAKKAAREAKAARIQAAQAELEAEVA